MRPEYCGGRPLLPASLDVGPELRLLQVQVLTRHGARTPAAPCDEWLPDAASIEWQCEDSYLTESLDSLSFKRRFGEGKLKGNCETGQLLPEGKEQHLELGRRLAQRYGEFAKCDEIFARSSDLSRTRLSVEALLSGYLGNAQCEIDLNVVDFETDWIYPNPLECRDLASTKIPYVTRLDTELDATFQKWNYGTDMAGSHLLDCVMTAVCDNRTESHFPPSFDPELADRLVAQSEELEYRKLRHDNYSKMASAPVLKHIRSMLANRGIKFAAWSAHDTSVMPLKVALGVDNGKWAPYADATIIELWTTSQGEEEYVRLVANGEPQFMSGCSRQIFCPLSLFLESTEWALNDYCGETSDDKSLLFTLQTNTYQPRAAVHQMTALVAATAGLLVGFLVGRKRRK